MNMEEQNTQTQQSTTTTVKAGVQRRMEALKMGDLFRAYAHYWYWFLISVIICVLFGIYKIVTTQPSYKREASILIENSQAGQSFGQVAGNFGITTPKISLRNEMGMMISRPNIRQVVRNLHLDVNYSVKGTFHDNPLYGTTLPANVVFLDLKEGDAGSMVMEITKNGNLVLSHFKKGGVEYNKAIKGKVNQTIDTPLGRLAVIPNAAYLASNEYYNVPITVKKSPLNAVAESCYARTSVDEAKNSELIFVRFTDSSPERAEDYLNMFIEVYNENWMDKKNKRATGTIDFIDKRLSMIAQDLDRVDSDISNFKSTHMVPNVDAAASLYMSQAENTSHSVQNLRNQEYMVRHIRNYLSNDVNRNQLLPANSGIENVNLSGQIENYNAKMLERNSLVTYGGESNPLVGELDQQLGQMRNALISSLDNSLISLNTNINSQEGFGAVASAQIASNPHQAKYLMSVERRQKVKETEYMYLLQKRDETELSQAFSNYNSSIIDAPFGSSSPVAPVKKSVIMSSVLAGLLIPAIIIFLIKNFDTKVHRREDLEGTSLPLVGEIPFYGKKLRRTMFDLFKRDSFSSNPPNRLVVHSGTRNSINEAFRVVRTNLDFLNDGHNRKVVAVTSANPDSGKTFITFNLAACVAIKGLKVAVVDLDLRKGSLSEFAGSPHVGMSNYLVGHSSLRDIVVHNVKNTGVDMFPIGSIPPNPTELLFSPRIQEMFETLRNEYDYIFIDCPPIGIVADADIVNKYCDMTIFVVRAGLFDKRLLTDVERHAEEGKLRNVMLLINGTEGANIYYRSRYGAKYYSKRSRYTVDEDENED